MNTHELTDVGIKRDANEDAVLTASIGEQYLLVVADGMGGHAAGDVASDIATTQIEEIVANSLPAEETEYEAILANAISAANREIHAHATDDPSLSGMGTTVVAAIIDEAEATVANVGDSRCYHIDDDIEQVTIDQSLVQELIEAGEITEAEAKDHPQRNVISQSLGTTDDVEPDFYTQGIDGTLLLCSDGLTEEVSDSNIAKIVSEEPTLTETAETLVHRANQNGGSDNITVAVCTRSEEE
ncbi:phosphoprotein phosphatase [Natronomonas moolapensis 8.8.11]|uniref:Phosphoprotein phosphatase n=1 Tax=Natronomonas moolapensis (strain DSM 18674 / CECT 7526 / JCM 14361 / 8.8.11) TaxID=268739 RepID=M1XRA4_NATM8|nr:Stp1/IreP family PP2C-type Ser/Thr phosphatase [Natronomonas moolapensis]CCQ36706.1 phosphoprotein phosphatase [Natronomonas moolapensis 8.8.11]